ncbi:MAG: VOC family protein [Nostocaceae cyanobacterium]|nr:VOC family protein [Nostocaceae cyanobacterium]
MSDVGLTHIALTVSDMQKSISFYAKYAGMKVVHHRIDEKTQTEVVWISDLTRPFIIVLIQVPEVKHPLLPSSHLGVACKSKEEIDCLCNQALSEGVLIEGPHDWGQPVGYWALIRDPDGHTLEISYGQEVRFTVENIGISDT